MGPHKPSLTNSQRWRRDSWSSTYTLLWAIDRIWENLYSLVVLPAEASRLQWVALNPWSQGWVRLISVAHRTKQVYMSMRER